MNDLAGCLDCQGDADGNQLCRRCADRLLERLRELPGLYVDLADYLEPSSSGLGGNRRTKNPDAPLPAVEDVLSLRGPGGMLGYLESWAAALWSDLGQGERPVSGSYESRLGSAIGSIRFNFGFVVERWPPAGDLSREVRELHQAAESIVDPKPKRVRVGYCTALVDDGTECQAVLWWTPGEQGLKCRWCGYEVPPSTWLLLACDQFATVASEKG